MPHYILHLRGGEMGPLDGVIEAELEDDVTARSLLARSQRKPSLVTDQWGEEVLQRRRYPT